MRFFFLVSFITISMVAYAQQEGDTALKRCPVYITDTVSTNNFFLEFQPATLKVYRVRGKLTVLVEQRDQFFSIFFNEKKLEERNYKIMKGGRRKSNVEAKYSFRSGDQVSYVDVSSGTIECTFDKNRDMWRLKVNGLLANLVGRSVTYFKVRADLYIR